MVLTGRSIRCPISNPLVRWALSKSSRAAKSRKRISRMLRVPVSESDRASPLRNGAQDLAQTTAVEEDKHVWEYLGLECDRRNLNRSLDSIHLFRAVCLRRCSFATALVPLTPGHPRTVKRFKILTGRIRWNSDSDEMQRDHPIPPRHVWLNCSRARDPGLSESTASRLPQFDARPLPEVRHLPDLSNRAALSTPLACMPSDSRQVLRSGINPVRDRHGRDDSPLGTTALPRW